jgi:GSCFA family
MARQFDTCPYNGAPQSSRWINSVTDVSNDKINPHTEVDLRLTPEFKIASAGSCFAQNVSRVLQASGFNYWCVEPAPSWLSEAERAAFNYGIFSARYGNIYTPRQLLQLFQRALGHFTPVEPAWVSPEGRVFDPFRPRIQPDGFDSIEEMEADRAAHLDAVRKLMETLDVLVFTLGLSETWLSKTDGAVFPVAPGCGAGTFDPTRHEFHNLRVSEVVDDVQRAFKLLHSVNPKARIILTVSPVALQATMTDRHVLQATVYSKSVLRAAAEEVVLADPRVTYFASYEIITATLNNERYYAADKRSVTDPGVNHVMDCFFALFAPGARPASMAQAAATPLPVISAPAVTTNNVCDEDAISEALAEQRRR